MESKQLDPSKIMQIGMGFWASKTLLTAVNLKLFTYLSDQEKSGIQIKQAINLHDRSLYDFLDALVSLGFLNRTGIKESAMYSNAPESGAFLDENKPQFIGGILKMANNRLYPFWNDLEEALKTGLPQNEAKNNEESIFELVYSDPKKLKEFVHAMAGVQMGNFITFAKSFDFSNVETLCDIGGSGGFLSAHVAMNNPSVKCISFDLPQVQPIAKAIIDSMQISDNVSIVSGDFFEDKLPTVDVITMGNILHDWGRKEKMILIKKAYDSLPVGGKLVIIENIIDDERRVNSFGLLMSLNMLIETESGYDFSKLDFEEMAIEVGFSKVSSMPLTGPTSALIAIK